MNKIKPFYLIALIGIFYGILILLNPYKSIFYGDVGLMFIQVQDLIKSGYSTFSLTYSGESFDPEFKFFPYTKPFVDEISNNHFFVFPPYFLALSAILYQLLGVIGLYALNYFSFLFTLILIYKIGMQYELENHFVNLSLFLYVFGMTASNYNTVFHELPFSIFWITLSTYFATEFLKNNNKLHLFLFGMIGGVSLFFRLEMVFVIFGCGVALGFLRRDKFFHILKYSLSGFIIPFIILIVFNYQIYNHPFGLRYLLNLNNGQPLGFKEKFRIIYDLLFLKSIGLFYQSPYIIIVFLFPFLHKKIASKKNWFLFLVISISLFCILATSPNNGGHISPRYLFGIYPILSIFSVIFLKFLLTLFADKNCKYSESFIIRNSNRILLFVFSALVLLSVSSTFKNYRWMQKASANVELFNSSLKLKTGNRPIIFRDYSQPLNAQSLYVNQMTFVVEKDEELLPFLNKLKESESRFCISQIFPLSIDEQSKNMVEANYVKNLQLEKTEENYRFSDGLKSATFDWISFGTNQTLLILNIF